MWCRTDPHHRRHRLRSPGRDPGGHPCRVRPADSRHPGGHALCLHADHQPGHAVPGAGGHPEGDLDSEPPRLPQGGSGESGGGAARHQSRSGNALRPPRRLHNRSIPPRQPVHAARRKCRKSRTRFFPPRQWLHRCPKDPRRHRGWNTEQLFYAALRARRKAVGAAYPLRASGSERITSAPPESPLVRRKRPYRNRSRPQI